MPSVFLKNNLQYGDLLFAVQADLAHFWNAHSPIPRKKTVLLKPNLLSPHLPQESITTHPDILRLVIAILKEHQNKIIIADSPAGNYNRHMEKIWQKTGMSQLAKETNTHLVNINKMGLLEKKGIQRNFFFSELLAEVDYIVNLPKLKTHGLTIMTGAIKNVFGLIPGIQKGEFHIQYPNPRDFAANMVDIYAAVRPQFTIMDGISILEGNGPSSGGTPKYLGCLLAGEDAVALDATAANIFGFDPQTVDMIRIAGELKIGTGDLQNIAIIGDTLKKANIQIPAPHIFNRLPGFVHSLLKKMIWTRPRANAQKCSHCAMCIKNCPAEAMAADKSGVPIIDYQKCINCFCCSEVCPDSAIFQESSWLVKKLGDY